MLVDTSLGPQKSTAGNKNVYVTLERRARVSVFLFCFFPKLFYNDILLFEFRKSCGETKFDFIKKSIKKFRIDVVCGLDG